MDRTEGQDVSFPVPKGMKEHKILPKMEKKEVNREVRGPGHGGRWGGLGARSRDSSHREMRGPGQGGGGEAWVPGAEMPVVKRKSRFCHLWPVFHLRALLSPSV